MICYNNVRYPSLSNPKEIETTGRMDRYEEAREDKIESTYSLDLNPQKYTEERFGLWGWFQFTKNYRRPRFIFLSCSYFVIFVCSDSERRGKMLSSVMSSSQTEMCIFGDDSQNI